MECMYGMSPSLNKDLSYGSISVFETKRHY